MRVTFLGTGTSHGVPQIGCDCPVCRSTDPRNNRLRTAALFTDAGTAVMVDATPDVRLQCLRANLRRLDAVLLTHAHADHFLGLDDLRTFTNDAPLPVMGSAATLADVQRVFAYACTEKPAYPGVPRLELRPLDDNAVFQVGPLAFRAIPVLHKAMPVLGYIVNGAVGYVTDCNFIPPATIEALRGVQVLILDGLRHRPHIAHFTVAEAIAVAQQIGAPVTFLTHLCHDLDHAVTEAALPAGIRLAYDELQLEVTGNAWRVVE